MLPVSRTEPKTKFWRSVTAGNFCTNVQSPGHASYASLLTNRLSQATVGCLLLAYSFSPRVHSIPRGPRNMRLYLQCKLYFDFVKVIFRLTAEVKVNPQLAQRANITPKAYHCESNITPKAYHCQRQQGVPSGRLPRRFAPRNDIVLRTEYYKG